ncbi:hypothetical protein CLOM_g4459 [Closterium sp. NIES-68]|nr:hypothetical protein CLOM_g4459 [Closterium sp. NIES-68]
MCGIALVAQRLRAGEDGRTGSGCDAPCDCERPRQAHSCQSGCATCNQDTAQEPITSSPSHSQTASVLQPSLLQQSAAPHLVCACIGSPSIESLAASLHRRGPDRSSALSLQLPPLQVQVPCVIPVAAPPLELPFESTQKAPGFSPAFSPQVGLPEQHERNVGAAAAHSLPEQHLQDRSLQEQHSLLLEERKLRENLPLPVTRLSLLGAVLQQAVCSGERGDERVGEGGEERGRERGVDRGGEAGEVTQPLMDQHGNVLLFNGEIFGGLPGLQPSENDSLALLSALSSCCPCYRPSPRSLRSTSPSLNPSTITATTKISDVSITTTVGNSSSSSSSTGNSNSRTSAGSCSSSTSTGRSSSSSATPIDPLAHSPALPSSPLSARPTPLCGHPHSIPRLLSSLRGPFALAYWQATAGVLWLARDFMGRRSLLFHGPCDGGDGSCAGCCASCSSCNSCSSCSSCRTCGSCSSCRTCGSSGNNSHTSHNSSNSSESSSSSSSSGNCSSSRIGTSSSVSSTGSSTVSCRESSNSSGNTRSNGFSTSTSTGNVATTTCSCRGEGAAEGGAKGAAAPLLWRSIFVVSSVCPSALSSSLPSALPSSAEPAEELGEVSRGRGAAEGGAKGAAVVGGAERVGEKCRGRTGGKVGERAQGKLAGGAGESNPKPALEPNSLSEFGYWKELPCGIYSTLLSPAADLSSNGGAAKNRGGVARAREGVREGEDEWEWRMHEWEDETVLRLLTWQRPATADGVNQDAELAGDGAELANSNTELAAGDADSAADAVLAALDRAVGMRVRHIREGKHSGSRKERLKEPRLLKQSREGLVAPVAAAVTVPVAGVVEKRYKEVEVAPVAVLFSGGLDSMLLAALAHRHVSIHRPIELLNVSFAGAAAPDRQTALHGVRELMGACEGRRWHLVEVDSTLNEVDQVKRHLLALLCPSHTHMDLNIGAALWLAARGEGRMVQYGGEGGVGKEEGEGGQEEGCRGMTRGEGYRARARVVLVGTGADEQCGGYARYRTKFRQGGWPFLETEMREDVRRLWRRNLGRDDRCLSDHGREPRFPFLDEGVMSALLALPLPRITDLHLPPGTGDKLILRQIACKLGLRGAAALPKRAIQFGSRIAKEANKRDFGSNRAANSAAVGERSIFVTT